MDTHADPHDLERFVVAQAHDYARALAELRAGRKRTHWIWYVFPQIAGLGASPMAKKFAIADKAEARVYLAHAVLGPRLLECANALIAHRGANATAMLGEIDAIKVRSSMTLFAAVADDGHIFDTIIDQYYGGARDPATLALLRG